MMWIIMMSLGTGDDMDNDYVVGVLVLIVFIILSFQRGRGGRTDCRLPRSPCVKVLRAILIITVIIIITIRRTVLERIGLASVEQGLSPTHHQRTAGSR